VVVEVVDVVVVVLQATTSAILPCPFT